MARSHSSKKPKRCDIRALPEPDLYDRIAAEAKRMRTTLGGFLLLAAEEKLARAAKRGAAA